jgi:fructose-specific phosphotransferase system IIC component
MDYSQQKRVNAMKTQNKPAEAAIVSGFFFAVTVAFINEWIHLPPWLLGASIPFALFIWMPAVALWTASPRHHR